MRRLAARLFLAGAVLSPLFAQAQPALPPSVTQAQVTQLAECINGILVPAGGLAVTEAVVVALMTDAGGLAPISVPGPGFVVEATVVAGAYVCAAVAPPAGDLSPGQVR